jgi:hypothetical protein
MPQSGLSKPVSRGRQTQTGVPAPRAARGRSGRVLTTAVNAGAVKTEWSQFSCADAQTYRTAGYAYGRPRTTAVARPRTFNDF